MAFIVSSVFYNLPHTTASFYNRGGLLFFAVLLNAFGSALEVGVPGLVVASKSDCLGTCRS